MGALSTSTKWPFGLLSNHSAIVDFETKEKKNFMNTFFLPTHLFPVVVACILQIGTDAVNAVKVRSSSGLY